MQKYLLTKVLRNGMMIFHTVILCPFVAMVPNMNILSQDVDAVKWEVVQI